MTNINLEPMVIDVQVAAARSFNDLMRAIAESFGKLGYAEVEINDGVWGVYVPSGDEHVWVPGTVNDSMLSVKDLVEAYDSKGWLTIYDDKLVTIRFPKITTTFDGEEVHDRF